MDAFKTLKIPLAVLILLIFFLIIPNFALRAAITCMLVYILLNSIAELKKPHVFLILLSLYYLAFVAPSYWILFHSRILRLTCSVLLPVFGILWAYFSSSSVKLDNKFRGGVYLFILAVLIFGVNYAPLNADIPFRGDEDYHILAIFSLFSYMRQLPSLLMSYLREPYIIWAMSFLLIFMAGLYFLRKRKVDIYVRISMLYLFLCIPFLAGQSDTKYLRHVANAAVRYPFLQRWFQAVFVYRGQFNISLYRAVPFVSAVFLSWFLFKKFNERLDNKPVSLAYAFCLVTIPTVYFYSNLMYLEMPVVLLMTVCLFDIKALLNMEYSRLITRPSWYCLIVMVLLKETVLIFFVVLLGARVISRMRQNRLSLNAFSAEIRTCLLLFAPLLIYIIFRLRFEMGEVHRFWGDAGLIFNISNYGIVARALFNQTGMLLIIAILGLFQMILKKERLIAAIVICFIIGSTWFYMITRPPLHIGNARFNLFFVPMLYFCLFYHVMPIKKYYYNIAVVAALFIANIWLVPINLDGVRLPNWGVPCVDGSEYVYPYREAVKWLSEKRDTYNHLLVTGNYYVYNGLGIYFRKYAGEKNFRIPRTTRLAFGNEKFDENRERFLLASLFDGFKKKTNKLHEIDIILYHSVNNLDLNDSLLYGGIFKIEKKISNSEHSLYIFRRVK